MDNEKKPSAAIPRVAGDGLRSVKTTGCNDIKFEAITYYYSQPNASSFLIQEYLERSILNSM
jgi:hypothetical protein